jgi:hypothetical protein
MRLKIGIFASSGAAAFFEGIVNWLTGNDSGKLFASEDGQSFKEIKTPVFGTSNVNDVFYGVDLSVPTITPDNINTGISWTTSTTTNATALVAYGNNLWVAVSSGANNAATSTNGSTWTTQASNLNTFMRVLGYGNGQWIAGGNYGFAFISTNGVAWTSLRNEMNLAFENIRAITHNNNLWVAGATNGRMSTSTNGSTWTTVNSNFGNTQIRSIAYGNNLWIAGGYTGQMRTSTNGSTWTTVNSNFGNTQIRSIAYGNNLWVAGGYTGQMRTSTNGSTWTTVTSNFGNTVIQSIAYGNNLWIAGGYTGQMRTSTNGSTWTTVNSNFGNTVIQSIAYGNNLWVAGGYTGQIRTSSQLFNTEYPNTFLAAGNDGKLAKSSDGLSWSTINTSQSTAINNIGFGNNTYYIGGV